MGKSTVSCLKIITCGSDSVGHDDLQNIEIKDSTDRRGWSFRKRSARHRVLSSTVISEAASSANKDSPESTPVNFQVQPNLTVPEKTSVIQWAEEKTELSAPPSKLPVNTGAKEDDSGGDAILDESGIIVIQAAIRRCLAQRVLLKQKNIIKLQAVVRGHLVRRHAVGTLRCVQAIVKIQTLVRARQARHRLVHASGDQDKQSGGSGKGNHDLTLSKSKQEAKPNGTYEYISIEKLLSNRFAIQLMESTPRTKPINIKCEPSKFDSSWKWLERWMSVLVASIEEPQESESAVEQHKEEKLGLSDGNVEDVLVPSDCYSEPTDFKSGMRASPEASEDDDNLITYDANKLDLQACKSISPLSSHPELQNIGASNSRNDVTESAPTEIEETDLTLNVDINSLLDKKETGNERDTPDMRKISVEQPETEAKRFSRKASNPAFIAAHSKFEELTSDSTSGKLTTSSHDEPGVESNLDKVSLSINQPFRSREIDLAENSIPNASTVQIGGSECGTELSISSTLDSPDRSEVGFNDLEQEPKLPDVTDHPKIKENLELEANGTHSILGTNPSHIKTNQLESVSSAPDESVSSVISTDSPHLEKEPKSDPNNLPLELGSEPSHSVYKSSPEASSRSHASVPESQATPSSQLSIKPKQSTGEKSESSPKNRSSSADLKSRLKTNQDSPSRISLEQLQKEHKTGKRRNSSGLVKPDHADPEPRDSNSSNSLPSYMQATESARAKSIANGSPRSSPEVQDKDIYIKKRQSLPGTNGRQESLQVQRALSQAQQNAKGNGNHSPQERKWRR